jgi:dethiobiotin synthetase
LLLVASTKLGTINHTLLSIECAHSAGIPLKGLVLSGPTDPGLEAVLARFEKLQFIAHIPELTQLSPAIIRQTAPLVFTQDVLRKLFE